ncbi:hypothetical protein [Spirosoma telluris]|uniref:hypothetical protein n=1 Tax=Spirosoma telluris TaxID=2183553 RepID=UPI002FC3B867
MINIRTRLTYQFVFLVTLILLFFSLGVYFFSKLYLEKRFYKRLQDRAITTTTLLFDLQQTDSTVLRLIDAAGKEPLLNENISVYNEKTKEILFSTNPANTQFHEQFIPQLDSTAQTLYLQKNEYQIVAIHLAGGDGGNWVIVSGIDQAERSAGRSEENSDGDDPGCHSVIGYFGLAVCQSGAGPNVGHYSAGQHDFSGECRATSATPESV